MMTTTASLLPLLQDDRALRKARSATRKAMRKCSPAARELVHKQLAELLSAWLDLDLVDLVIDAWRGWDDLVEAAERTRREPGLRLVVDVAKQRFSTGREATLEIVVDDLPPITLPVRLEIELEVRALSAALQGGCITDLNSGDCKVQATLLIDDVALPPYELTLDLTLTLQLNPPLPLGPGLDAERGQARDNVVRMPDAGTPARQPIRP